MTTRTKPGVLHRMKDTDLRLDDPRADIRGFRVFDTRREELGKVGDLLIDEQERKVRFIEVEAGGFLGIGKEQVLLPVEAVSEIHDDVVRVNQSREQVTGAPEYDPRLVEQPYLSQLYGYYGYRTPFWGAGYTYPRYPYL